MPHFIPVEEILDPKGLYAHRKTVPSPEQEGDVPGLSGVKEVKEPLEDHVRLAQGYYKKIIGSRNLRMITERFRSRIFDEDEPRGEEEDRLFYEITDNLVTFHDLGKINPVFQREKMGNPVKEKAFRDFNTSRHSAVSAVLYADYFLWKLREREDRRKEEGKPGLGTDRWRNLILSGSYIIARHHSDLCDMDSFLKGWMENGEFYLLAGAFLEKERQEQERVRALRGLRFFRKETDLNRCGNFARQFHGESRKMKSFQNIAFFGFTRLMYSLLAAADYCATAEFETGIITEDFGKWDSVSINEIRKEYEGTELIRAVRRRRTEGDSNPEGEKINDLRSELFLEAEQEMKAHREQFLFFLEAPTGSGKSNTAFNLSLNLLEQGQEKLIYVYPLNTLIDQNVQSLRKIFGEKGRAVRDMAVVNSLHPIKVRENPGKDQEEEAETDYEGAFLDRQFLHYPFLITSHAGFFQTLFGARREDVFGFYQMSGSVVVLDEIQSYRNKIWAEWILFLTELAPLLNMKVLMMSATLPRVSRLIRPEEWNLKEEGRTVKIQPLLPDSARYFRHPVFKDRVRADYSLLERGEAAPTLEQLAAHILENAGGKPRILVEFIKKKTAREFYRILKEDGAEGYETELMTGDDSEADRKETLRKINGDRNRKLILIGTQVVEAGLDIDMDLGYKDISMLDSEEQFLGRINRSCLREGKVFFFNLDEAGTIYREDVRINDGITLKNPEMRHLLEEKNFEPYYEKVMRILMENRNRQTTEEGMASFFSQCLKPLCFPEIERRMRLIDPREWEISVFLNREITLPDGNRLSGSRIWDAYRETLRDSSMGYGERKILLSRIRSEMANFIYKVCMHGEPVYTDRIGDLFYIDDGEAYFENGKFCPEKVSAGPLIL